MGSPVGETSEWYPGSRREVLAHKPKSSWKLGPCKTEVLSPDITRQTGSLEPRHVPEKRRRKKVDKSEKDYSKSLKT
jgi:hypothetical protein